MANGKKVRATSHLFQILSSETQKPCWFHTQTSCTEVAHVRNRELEMISSSQKAVINGPM